MFSPLDHIDLRVPKLRAVTPFYEALLPALGFCRRVEVDGWLQFEVESEDSDTGTFFGITEDPQHRPNQTRLAFRCRSADELETFATLIRQHGGQAIEGPELYEPGYHALFFEDPAGNRLEICHRLPSN